MASFALSATTCGACKHAWTKIRTPPRVAHASRLDQNNGQLCFVRHHKWRTQARLDQLIVLMAVACTYTIYRFLFEETERDIAFEFWF